jgi:hypothetical protein
MEEPTRNTPDEEPTSEETLGRRQLLKALAATTGAIAASSMLPGEWAKPVVEAGVLPAHAQVTPTSPPTATPVLQPVAIIACLAVNAADGTGLIFPDSTIRSSAQIDRTEIVQLRQTINVVGQSSPFIYEGFTDSTGLFSPPDFDLSSLNPLVDPNATPPEVSIVYEVIDPDYIGVNNCTNDINVLPGM